MGLLILGLACLNTQLFKQQLQQVMFFSHRETVQTTSLLDSLSEAVLGLQDSLRPAPASEPGAVSINAVCHTTVLFQIASWHSQKA